MDLAKAAEKHVRHLCEVIGERFIGTPGNRQAADYIETVFKASGLETRRLSFPCPAWTCSGVELKVEGQPIDAKVNTFSPACQVSAPLEVVFTLEALRQVILKDKILVMCGELTKQPLADYRLNAVYMPELDRETGALLREKRPLAIILINQTPGYDVLMLEDMRLDLPSVSVSAEDGVKLLSYVSGAATLSIDSSRGVGETWHIVGHQKRADNPYQVLLGAHYDSRYGTVGAFDNASGAATLLALANYFAEVDASVALEFVAFSAEEYATEDTFEEPYLKQFGLSLPPFVWGQEIMAPYRPSGLDEVIAMLNFDGMGHAISANTLSTMACSDELKKVTADIKQAYPDIVLVDGWPASNHYGFYANGIPSLPFNSVAMGNLIHHSRDDLRYLSFDKLAEVARFAVQLVEALQNKTPDWARAFSLAEAQTTLANRD